VIYLGPAQRSGRHNDCLVRLEDVKMNVEGISSVDTIHAYYVSMCRARQEKRTRNRGTFFANASKAAWYLSPYINGLKAVVRNGRAHPRRIRQLIQVPLFMAQYRVSAECYYQYRLYFDWNRRGDYIFHNEIVAILDYLNSRSKRDADDLSDKRRFFRRCIAAHLPTVPIFVEFENGATLSCTSPSLAREQDLFSKYANRYCGEGATLWQFSSGLYCGLNSSFSLQELQDYLARLSLSHPVVLQPKISNSAELRPISGKGLSTARVITIRRPNCTPEVALASYRMPVGEHVADNFAAGGIACPISLRTGILGSGSFKASGDRQPVNRHPDSRAAITGRTVPYWAAVKELAVAAHSTFETMASIGWDIAITDEGPTLLEGNAVWCVDLAQMSHRQPLSDTSIPACLSEHLNSRQDRTQLRA
jgi:hypothetical protein